MSKIMTKRRGHRRGHGHGRKNKRTMRRRRSHSAHLTRSRRHHRHGSRARRGGMFAAAAEVSSANKAVKAAKFLIEQGDELKKRLEAAKQVRPSASSVRGSMFKSATESSMAANLSKGFDASRISAAAKALMIPKSSKPNMGG